MHAEIKPNADSLSRSLTFSLCSVTDHSIHIQLDIGEKKTKKFCIFFFLLETNNTNIKCNRNAFFLHWHKQQQHTLTWAHTHMPCAVLAVLLFFPFVLFGTQIAVSSKYRLALLLRPSTSPPPPFDR